MGLRFFEINKYEPTKAEKRLEEFAAKGEFISFYSDGIANFKKGEPKKLRYCIEVSASGPDAAKLQFYDENGWKLACRGSSINIFTSEDENAAPIYTDSSDYAHAVKDLHSLRVRCIVLMLVCIVLVGFPQLFISLLTKRHIMMIAEGYMIYSMPFIVIEIIFYVFAIIIYIRDMAKAARFISGNIESGKIAEKTVKTSKLLSVTAVLISAAAFINSVLYCYCAAVSDKYKTGIEEVPAQAIMAESVYPDGRFISVSTKEGLDYIDPAKRRDTDDIIEDKVTCYTSAVTNKYYECGVYIPEGEDYGEIEYINGKYIEFKSEYLAKKAEKEIVDRSMYLLPNEISMSEIDVSGSELDSVNAVNGGIVRVVVLRRGETVWVIETYTPDFTAEELSDNIMRSF